MNDVRILLLEDSPTDAELIEREVQRSGLVSKFRRVETPLVLVDNAFSFTLEGGQVTIEAAVDDDIEGVSDRDTGRGLKPQDEARVFERFFQAEQNDLRARNGLGLGLYICRDLIERQGSASWIESTLGVGTSVTFTVPTLTSDVAAQA